jgi:hypothetical protein
MNYSSIIFILFCGYTFAAPTVAHGQDDANAPIVAASPVDKVPEDVLGRGNPSVSITGQVHSP